MNISFAAIDPTSMASAIAWFYLVTYSTRMFSFLPQIIAVWRCRDGGRAISLLTWCSWMISHAAAALYGALVVHDPFFVLISVVNLLGCAAVTLITAHRRGLLGHGPAPAGRQLHA